MNPNHPDSCESQFDMFKEAYAWLHGKAAERGLADNGRGMIWAWYRFNGESRRKPDVRTLRKESTAGKELCCLTLEVPEDKVLLMDSDQWQCRLSGFACVTAEQEAMDSDEYIRWLDGLYAMPEADRRSVRCVNLGPGIRHQSRRAHRSSLFRSGALNDQGSAVFHRSRQGRRRIVQSCERKPEDVGIKS